MFAKNNEWSLRAYNFLNLIFKNSEINFIYSNEKYKKFPKEYLDITGDYLISFLSPWIIPSTVLNNFSLAINFHPGPPEYPGAGCYNFALYEGSKDYGVTVHFINEEIDAGDIIKIKRFPIFENDNIVSLQKRTYDYMLILYYEIILELFEKGHLKKSNDKWKRKAFKRKDIEELCKLNFSMSKEEIIRRIRATYYPGMPGPYFEIYGKRFIYDPHR